MISTQTIIQGRKNIGKLRRPKQELFTPHNAYRLVKINAPCKPKYTVRYKNVKKTALVSAGIGTVCGLLMFRRLQSTSASQLSTIDKFY